MQRMMKVLSVILTFCMLLALVPVSVSAGSGAVAKIGDRTFGTVREAARAANAGDTIQLIADFAEAYHVFIERGTADKPITLDLNGYTLTGPGDAEVILVAEGCCFVLTDTSAGGKGVITQPSTNPATDYGGGVKNMGNFTMKAGTIRGCCAYWGGGVYTQGTFTLDGGVIDSCIAATSGGGVNAGYGSAFTFVSGTIQNCSAQNGGGVIAFTQNFKMTGGCIKNCRSESGGGIELACHANFSEGGVCEFSGGSIENCTATSMGGGIRLDYATLHLSGSARITGCMSTNESYSGGGIADYHGTLTVQGSPLVFGNTKNGSANNIFLDHDQFITLIGDFTGTIGVHQHIRSGVDTVFGTASADYAGADRFFCDNADLCGAISGTKLVWMRSAAEASIAGIPYNKVGDAFAAANDGDTILLKKNASLAADQTLTLQSGKASKPVTLDLNGYTLTGCGSKSVITIPKGNALSLTDSSDAGTGTITQKQNGVTGYPEYGGGIYNEGYLFMSGGRITGCAAKKGGGGIYNKSPGNQSVFWVSGPATVSNNTVGESGASPCDVESSDGACIRINGFLSGHIGVSPAVEGELFAIKEDPAYKGDGCFFGNSGSDDAQNLRGGEDPENPYNVIWSAAVARVGELTFASLDEAFAQTDGGNIELLTDATVSRPIEITADNCGLVGGRPARTLELNGYAVTYHPDATAQSLFILSEGAGLMVNDATPAHSGKITWAERITEGVMYGGGAFYIGSGAVLEMTCCTIEGCCTNTPGTSSFNCGGAVYNLGTFLFNYGVIRNCYAGACGGGIYTSGSCTLKHSKISGCSAGNAGGGVYVASGSLTMKESKIIGCSAQTGGGIEVLGDLAMTDGTVTGCISTNNGSGVFISSGAHMYLAGAAEIVGNTKGEDANDLYLYDKNNLVLVGDFTGTVLADCSPSGDGYPFGTADSSGYSGAENILSQDREYVGQLIRTENENRLLWQKAYSVTFDVSGHGTAPAAQAVGFGQKAKDPGDPVADGYYFAGWYTEPEYQNHWYFPVNVVTGDLTLYARWLQIIPVPGSQGGTYNGRPQTGIKADDRYTAVDIPGTTVSNATNAGTYQSAVKPADGCCWPDGSVSAKVIEWSIVPKDISLVHVDAIAAQDYNGDAIVPGLSVTDGDFILVCGTDYTVKGENNKDPGTATLWVTGVNNYMGKRELGFTIHAVQATVSKAPVACELTYNGDDQDLVKAGTASGGSMRYSLDGETWSTAVPTGKYAGDYTVFYKAAADDTGHTDSGVGTVAVTIARRTVQVSFSGEPLTYNGNGQVPSATVTNKAKDTDNVSPVVTGAQTDAGTGYTATVNGLVGSDVANYQLPDPKPAKTFEIAKAPGEWKDPATPVTAYFGQTLADVALPAGYAWKSGTTPVGDLTSDTGRKFDAAYTSDKNHLPVAGQIPVIVTKGPKVEDVITKIGQIGTVEFTDACKARIDAAEQAYNGLSDGQKGLITAEQLQILTDAKNQYEKLRPYEVTFSPNGHGTAPEKQFRIIGSKIEDPGKLTAEGYVFGGWYRETGCLNRWNFETDTVQGATVLYAKWLTVIAIPTPVPDLVYNGAEQTGVEAGEHYRFSLDGGNNKATNAGPYLAYAIPENGYCWPDGMTDAKTISWQIAPKPVAVDFDPTLLVYNGDPQAPKTAVVNKANETDDVSVTVTGARTDAGEGYTATAIGLTGADAGNYVLPDPAPEKTFAIAKAPGEWKDPGRMTADYGQKLADVALPKGYAWKNASLSVGNVTPEGRAFDAVYEPDTNHTPVEGPVIVTVVRGAAVENAAKRIREIGNVEVSVLCKARIDRADEACLALSEGQRALLTEEERQILADAKEAYAILLWNQRHETASDALIQRAIRLIQSIGDVEYTSACKAKIDAADRAYRSLPKKCKDRIPDDVLQILNDAKNEYARLQTVSEGLRALTVRIEAIGEVEPTDACKARIDAARAAYDAAEADVLSLLDAKYEAMLRNAEERYKELSATQPSLAILEGSNAVYALGSLEPLVFRGNGEVKDYVRTRLDGRITIPDHFLTVKEGSTIVEIDPAFLDTLSEGTHTVTIEWTNGSASANFRVEREPSSPQTGDGAPVALLAAGLVLSLAGAMVFRRKRVIR